MSEYATIDQLRDEGVSDDIDDAALLRVIQRTSMWIELWTRRWFYPKRGVYLIDGKGHEMLLLNQPIINISRVRVLQPDTTYITSSDEDVDLRSVRVYNRHLTQDLTDPDDREDPKLQWLTAWSGSRRWSTIFPTGWWPRGEQNIEVSGLFGYTDPDGAQTLWEDGITPVGKTPDAITTACMMLVVRDLLPLADLVGRNEAAMANRLTSVRTRDQSITWSQQSTASNSIGGASNGSGIIANAEVKALLEPYRRQPWLGAV